MQKNYLKNLKENNWKLSENSDFESLELCINNCDSPSKNDIFNAFYKNKEKNIIFKPEDIKVLILGQDPYPNPEDAHGLAFSSNNKKTPASLRNIFKAIDCAYNSNLSTSKTFSNNLQNWVNDGVLLLNTALTYEIYNKETDKKLLTEKEKNIFKKEQQKIQKKHIEIWEPFTLDIIHSLLTTQTQKPLVLFLWGNFAQNIFEKCYEKFFNDKKQPTRKFLILKTTHPSPQSVMNGFKEQAPKHFKQCNDFLKQNNEDIIKWWETTK